MNNNHIIRFLCAFLLLPMILPAGAQTLASFVDNHRVLLVFAPTGHDPRLQEQLTLLHHHAAEMKERDLLLVPILSQSGPPATPDILRELRPPVISGAEQLTTRHRFGVAPTQFAVILLGKDGDEKLRSSTPIPMEPLNRTIDAMPMRRREMRGRPPKP